MRIFEASKQLLTILNDLLDFAKLEAGRVDLESVPYKLACVLDEVVGLSIRKAQEKSLALSVNIDSELPQTIVGDPNKMRQILLNLVHNAIKFTESGGIEIAAERHDTKLFLSVTDTGIGIEEEAQKRLFQPFTQGHESTARLFGGTGLGLSIAQQFVELMNGKIGIASKVGRGTSVWFVLPLTQAPG